MFTKEELKNIHKLADSVKISDFEIKLDGWYGVTDVPGHPVVLHMINRSPTGQVFYYEIYREGWKKDGYYPYDKIESLKRRVKTAFSSAAEAKKWMENVTAASPEAAFKKKMNFMRYGNNVWEAKFVAKGRKSAVSKYFLAEYYENAVKKADEIAQKYGMELYILPNKLYNARTPGGFARFYEKMKESAFANNFIQI